MRILKFGGTSVADATAIDRATAIAAAHTAEGLVVVVSAQARVTDLLLRIADACAEAPTAAQRYAMDVLDHWRTTARPLALSADARRQALAWIDEAATTLRDLAAGAALVGECSPGTRDAIASLGELVSHRLFALALRARGVAAEPVDPRELVPTDQRFGSGRVDTDTLRARCATLLRPLLCTGIVPVTGGYVGRSRGGRTVTLGRGGSDLTATLLGAALDADEVQIWTDVNGMMTADPRLIDGARSLDHVSFAVAAELATFGARVLHPASIQPAVARGVAVRVRNTHAPAHPGTTIDARGPADDRDHPSGEPRPIAVVAKRGVHLVCVRSTRMLGAPGFIARVFAVFAELEVSVDVVTTAEVAISISVEDTDALPQLTAALGHLGDVHVRRDRALVCLIAHRLLQSPTAIGTALAALEDIPLDLVCLDSTDLNLTCAMPAAHADDAVRRLHARFLEPVSC